MKTIKQRILSCLLVACMIATFVPTFSIPAGAALAANQAIYSVNVEDDSVTNNVIVAKYNGKSYVMGPIQADGTAEAIPAVNRDSSGNNIVVNETTAELFTVSSQRYIYSNGSYSVYSLLTKDGYIVDTFGIDECYDHTLAKSMKESITLDDYPYFWRFDWDYGWYNWNNFNYRIYLVVDSNNGTMYFTLGSGTPDEGVEYITVNIFHKSCQHPNMEYVAAVAPTCKKDGNDEYWFCPDCKNANYSPYFSDADGLNGMFNPPVSMSYGAIDNDHDGVCDDCGKNMPVFRPVTDVSQIVAGGKYILVAKTGDKYYAAATGSEQEVTDLPAVKLTPSADGSFTFESAVDAMTIELQFANGYTEWGNGIRYGFVTKFNGCRSEFMPAWKGTFVFTEYEGGAKYGFYVGLNEDGTAKIHSAYEESDFLRSYAKDESLLFTFTDYSGNETYTAAEVYLYRLTDTGTVGGNTYDMTAVKSETDYTVYNGTGAAAEGGTNITGVPDALTQDAVNALVEKFVQEASISNGENVQINTSVNVTVQNYTAGDSIRFSLTPTAVVSGGGAEKTYAISDADFDGITPMTVTLYTGGISPKMIVHKKQDGTNEYFYPEYSEAVMTGSAKPFYELYDNEGNMYVMFTVTEFSDVQLLTPPAVKRVALTLNKGVTVNVAIDIAEAWLAGNPGAQVVFSNGTTIDAKAGLNVYSTDLTPAQINDSLYVSLRCGKTTILDDTNVSVATYRDKASAAGAAGLGLTEAKYNALIALVNAALTYSDYADGTGENLENDFADVEDAKVTHAHEEKLFTSFAGQLSTYASVYISVNTGIMPEGEIITVKIGNAEAYNGVVTEDGYIVIEGLCPANFDADIIITATQEGSHATFTFNSYLKAVYGSTADQQVKNFVVATYLYGLAAEDYIKA